MPDLFDAISPDPPPGDVFDRIAPAQSAKPAGDIFDRVTTSPQKSARTPQVPSLDPSQVEIEKPAQPPSIGEPHSYRYARYADYRSPEDFNDPKIDDERFGGAYMRNIMRNVYSRPEPENVAKSRLAAEKAEASQGFLGKHFGELPPESQAYESVAEGYRQTLQNEIERQRVKAAGGVPHFNPITGSYIQNPIQQEEIGNIERQRAEDEQAQQFADQLVKPSTAAKAGVEGISPVGDPIEASGIKGYPKLAMETYRTARAPTRQEAYQHASKAVGGLAETLNPLLYTEAGIKPSNIVKYQIGQELAGGTAEIIAEKMGASPEAQEFVKATSGLLGGVGLGLHERLSGGRAIKEAQALLKNNADLLEQAYQSNEEFKDAVDKQDWRRAAAIFNPMLEARLVVHAKLEGIASEPTVKPEEIPHLAADQVEVEKPAKQTITPGKTGVTSDGTRFVETGPVAQEKPGPQTKFRLPKNAAVAKVENPITRTNFRTVNIEGQNYAYDTRRTSADEVKQAVASGELWKLTGEQPPPEVEQRAAIEAKAPPIEEQAAEKPVELKPEEVEVEQSKPSLIQKPAYTGPERRNSRGPETSRIGEYRNELLAERDPQRRAELQQAIERESAIARGEQPQPGPEHETGGITAEEVNRRALETSPTAELDSRLKQAKEKVAAARSQQEWQTAHDEQVRLEGEIAEQGKGGAGQSKQSFVSSYAGHGIYQQGDKYVSPQAGIEGLSVADVEQKLRDWTDENRGEGPGTETITERLNGRASARIGTVTLSDGSKLTLSLRPDTSQTGRYSAVLSDGKNSNSYRVQYKGGDSLADSMRDFEEYLNTDKPGAFKVTLDPKQEPRAATEKPQGADATDKAKLKQIQQKQFKTYNDEQQIKHLQERIAADPSKWNAGDGVAWRVAGQVNRGFRVISVDHESKTAEIRSIADTGITRSGGDDIVGSHETVHVADLVRDRKYDKAQAAAAPGSPEYEAMRRRVAQLENKGQQPAKPSAVQTLKDTQGKRNAERLRTGADSLDAQIENARRPLSQNPTPKRMKEYRTRLHEADNLERTQKAMRALADAHEAGTVPKGLENLRSKADIYSAVYKGTTGQGGYYDVIPSTEYSRKTPEAKALQELLESKTAEPSETKTERERQQKISQLEADVQFQKLPGYFATPEATARDLVNRADIQPGMSVLEPSAGKGNIADVIKEEHPDAELSTIEQQGKLRQILELKGHDLVGSDFLDHHDQYDRIVMNPPFENGRDIDHVRHAYDLLNPGGKLVAIMGEGSFFRNDKKATGFRDWMDETGGSSEKLPAGAFKESGTGAASRIVEIEKPAREPISTAKQETTVQQGSRIAGNDGAQTSVLTPGGKQEAKYRIVEASSLKPSHDPLTFAKNPDYPEGVQERAYHSSKEAQNRVIQQAQNYEPSYTVNTNPDAVNGPPVILPDGTVLGGNSRAMSTARIYRSGQADAYRAALKDKAQQFGFDPQLPFKGMKESVLVREIQNAPTGTDEIRRLASDLNRNMTGALGVNERAVSAGKSIHPETLTAISGMVNDLGENATLRDAMRENGRAITAMMVRDGVITDRERPQFVDTSTGGLSDEGKRFVERALMGSVVDDPNLMDQIPKSVLGKLEGSLGDISSVGSRTDEYNLLPLLRESLADHAEMVRSGMSVEDYLKQGGMFGPQRNPATDALVRALAGKPSEFRKAMREFTADANYDVQNQGTLGFGQKPSAHDSFNAAFGAKLNDAQFADALLQSLKKEATISSRGQEGRTRPAAEGVQPAPQGNPPSGPSGRAAENRAGQATGKPEAQLSPEDSSGQVLHSGIDPMEAYRAIRKTITDAGKLGKLYTGAVDKLLEKLELGKPRPEIRQFDPDAADLALRVDAGGQYHKAKSQAIAKRVTGPLTEDFKPSDTEEQRAEKNRITRDRMKGFFFLADAQNREYAQKHHPDDYRRWLSDPRIAKAVVEYRPFMEDLRNAVKQLGGKTIDEDYIKRVMDFATGGIDRANTPGQKSGAGRDSVISPQVDRSRARKDEGDYYWKQGVYDFGPSFEKRWIEVMAKLDEHRLAVHTMARGTRLEAGDQQPAKIYYNGQEFYRPDIAKEIEEVQKRGPSPESKRLADELGVSELPAPKKVQQYAIYEPLKGSRFENAAKNLASQVFAGADAEKLKASAGQVTQMANLRYAVPKEIADVLQHYRPDVGKFSKMATKVLGPVTQLIRQQIIGLAYGIPHMGNILRKVMQSTPGSVLNPKAYANAWKVAFSRELKVRAISGPEDPGFDSLLRNAGISEGAIPDYKHYIEGNFDVKSWDGIQESAKTATNAFREGGKAEGKVTVKSAMAGIPRLAIEPLNRFSEAGHHNLFKPGGIDQRARLWLHDFLADRRPDMNEADRANAVNETLGRYNRASWTDVQKGIAPFMLFPGWDYSSISFAMKHPFKTAVAPAVLIFLANQLTNALGGNQRKDKNDLTRLHFGRYSVTTNLIGDNMGRHMWGWALRGGQAILDRKSPKQVTGEMTRGLPGDVAGVSTGTLNPIISTGLSLSFNRARPGLNPEIAPKGDYGKRGHVPGLSKATEDYGGYALRKGFPIYDMLHPEGNTPWFAAAGRVGGVNITKEQKKKR